MDEQEQHKLGLEDGGFLALVLIVSAAFAWLLTPYFGAILWGVVVAILFTPLYRQLAALLHGRHNLAAAVTLLTILLLVILPSLLIAASLVQEASDVYVLLRAGEIDPAVMFQRFHDGLPAWARQMLDRYGLSDLNAARNSLADALAAGLNSIASRALTVGQGALKFVAALGVMLYLTYFLLRDGVPLSRRVRALMPLRPHIRDTLLGNFVIVVRATMKGTVVVAIVQGVVGGLIFSALGISGALLWGVLMGFFSLVPAVGTAIVWVPMAAYLLITGSYWEGIVLIACGILVIGLIDNILRPILIGKDTRMPDFVVLIATLAGLDLFGLNGFIIGPVIAALFIAVWRSVGEIRGLPVDHEDSPVSGGAAR